MNSTSLRLDDAKNDTLSADSRFDLAYNAAHALALAALRWHGYRSDKRYLVFQCLVHTLEYPAGKCKVLTLCHQRRNRAEYEGYLEIDNQLLQELITLTTELESLVNQLAPITKERDAAPTQTPPHER